MEISVKYNLDDVKEKLLEEVTDAAVKAVKIEITSLTGTLRELVQKQADELNEILSIKDPKQRERVRKSLTRGLDKWTREVLK